MRDDFTPRTKETIAKRAGYLCSNPACKSPTVGAALSHDGIVNVGVAAHITAAAPGGPRYDSSLTPEERRHQSNGIWLCQMDGKLVDSDSGHFTVEMLRAWKEAAEKQSFHALVALHAVCDQRIEPGAFDIADQELLERLGLPTQDDLQSVTSRLLNAAHNDLVAFKRMPGWPRHAIALNLRMTDGNSLRAFNVSGLAAVIDTFNEMVVIAPPGTGKTTTLLQVAEAILSQANSVAAFIPLGEWSSQSDSFFQSVVRRHAFVGTREEHFQLLAHYGRLVLVLDGWNELDAASRKRAGSEIRALQREFSELGIVVSTRRQALDVPVSGPVVEIGALTEGQQLEIAWALRGVQGKAMLDHARRTSGVRELVAIPLYLTALIAHTPSGSLPTTKEEVLRLFVAEHEQAADKAEALREALFGCHTQMLTALAVTATRAANTTISDSQARAVVKRVEDQLYAEGQITIAPQPTAVLDVLVSYHTLVRSGTETGGLSFQHQQFQEWYASFEVEALVRAAAGSDQKSRQTLSGVDVLNMPAWEESLLFACERMSRADQIGLQAVAATILETMSIDPILAAEMIYRSSADVWDQIKEQIIAAVEGWHASGKVDRAVRFMISTGCSEFAAYIWPLITDVDSQVHLSALRAGRRFRPSVLGVDVDMRITQLPEEVREHVVSEIAMNGGMDGIELAARLAQADDSPTVQASVIEALQFRRADRFVIQVLRTATDEVWRLLARKGYAEEIADLDITGRLRRERQCYLDSETDPLRKIRVLLEAGRHDATLGHEVGALIEAADFPVRDQQVGWIIDRAHTLFPEAVQSALLRRLEGGQEIPFRTESLLQTAGVIVDDGPLADLVIQPNSPTKVTGAAVSIVGPNTIARLIDQVITVDRKVKASAERADEAHREEYYQLLDWLAKTRLSVFIEAVLTQSDTDKPEEIALLAKLLARHGEVDDRDPLHIHDPLYTRMVDTVGRWVEILLASTEATRHQFAEVACAIERLPAPQLVSGLQRLLATDLARWRRARDEAAAARARGKPLHPDAYTSWTLQYRRAFAAIGDSQTVELMMAYLPDMDFGVDAALVLKNIWDRGQNSPKGKRFSWGHDFSEVNVRRMARQSQSSESNSSPFADAIFAVVDDLAKSGAGVDAHRHALRLANIAFSLPYGNRTGTIDTLLKLPQPLAEKQGLLTVLILAGEIICADMVLDGIKTLLEEAKVQRWRLDENRGELSGWLELLPFTDCPRATLAALTMLEPSLQHPWRLRRVLSALGYAPTPDAENMLCQLAQTDSRFLSEHEWLAALENRSTASSARLLLDLICEGMFTRSPGGTDTWILSRKLARAIKTHAEFRAEVYQRYELGSCSLGNAILEHAIAEVADTDGVLVLVRSYSRQGKPFDYFLHSAIEHVAVGERPSANWVGAHEVFSMPIPELRKRLFALAKDDTAETMLAEACLAAIDELRDEYGPAESEPRHPDIGSGRPWPLLM